MRASFNISTSVEITSLLDRELDNIDSVSMDGYDHQRIVIIVSEVQDSSSLDEKVKGFFFSMTNSKINS